MCRKLIQLNIKSVGEEKHILTAILFDRNQILFSSKYCLILEVQYEFLNIKLIDAISLKTVTEGRDAIDTCCHFPS